jgi:hypothetical protein
VHFDVPADDESELHPRSASRQLLIKGYCAKWVPAPDNYASLIDEPSDLFAFLEGFGETRLLHEEKLALEQIRRLELIYALSRRKQLPEGMALCMNNTVEEILAEEAPSHLYVKYFHMLKVKYDLDLLAELTESFCSTMNNVAVAADREAMETTGRLALSLAMLLLDVCNFSSAHRMLGCLMLSLQKHDALETRLLVWKAVVKLFEMHNTNVNFTEAETAHKTATLVGEKIKQHPFGTVLIEESPLFCALSSSFREQGKTASAYSWALAALKV